MSNSIFLGAEHLKKIILAFLYSYRWFVSPFLKPRCRYSPSCSVYAIEAIFLHGVIKGFTITLNRFLRCRPGSRSDLYQGHYDPVPSPQNLTKRNHVKKTSNS